MSTVTDTAPPELESLPKSETTGFTRTFVLVGLITLIGLLLRVIGLDWESIWYDEACSLLMAEVSYGNLIAGEPLDIGDPPGYFAILRAWSSVFALTTESARMLSAICGAITIPFVWMLTTQITNDRRVATTATLLTAINPAMIFLSREARTFSIMIMLMVMMAWLMQRICHRCRSGNSSAWYWIGFAVICACLPYLHYYAFFVLAASAWPILYACRQHCMRTFWSLVAVYSFAALAFAPWMPSFFRQLNLWSSPDNPSLKHALYFPVYTFGGRTFIWKEDGLPLMIVAAIVVLGMIVLPSLLNVGRIGRKYFVALTFVIGVPGLAILASLIKTPMINCRYLGLVIPSILIIWSAAIWELPSRQRVLRLVAFFAIGLVTLLSLGRLYAVKHKHDWRSVAEHVRQRAPNLPVLFYEDIGETSFLYYRPEHDTMRLAGAFTDNGEAWKQQRYDTSIRKYADECGGFWVCFWVPDGRWGEQEAVILWLERDYEVVDEKWYGKLRLIWYQPRA